jgi:hypothetical protein
LIRNPDDRPKGERLVRRGHPVGVHPLTVRGARP